MTEIRATVVYPNLGGLKAYVLFSGREEMFDYCLDCSAVLARFDDWADLVAERQQSEAADANNR